MTVSKEIPDWMRPVELEEWPTRLVESTELCYGLPVPQGWNTTPQVTTASELEKEHIFRGKQGSEWLIVSFMERADRNSNIQNWVEAFVKITGFPILPMQQAINPPPRLVEWQDRGNCPPVAERLGVEEVFLYQGFAELPGTPPELARLYILLARRDTVAWKVSLSLTSACFPGMPEEIIWANDGVRAAAILGNLRLL
jgi:hypothetical protein